MKKLFTVLLIILAALCLFSCGKNEPEYTDMSVKEPEKLIFGAADLTADEFNLTLKALKDFDVKSLKVTAGDETQTVDKSSVKQNETFSVKFSGKNKLGNSFDVKCDCDGEIIGYSYVDGLPQLSISNASVVAKELTTDEIVSLMVLVPDTTARNLCGTTIDIERLGIPKMVLGDGTSGLRTNGATMAFPTISCLANTWNKDLVYKVAYNEGLICNDYGIDVLLSPGVNIKKNTWCGRNFEYFSEDPLLSGYLGASYVNGLQMTGVGASVKHYMANSQETDRALVSSNIDERTLREIYARSFEYVIQNSKPLSIMCSYNKVNGKYLLDSEDLVFGVLRNDFKYTGITFTDWHAGGSTANMFKSGLNVYCGAYIDELPTFRASISRVLERNRYEEENLSRMLYEILYNVAKTHAMTREDYNNYITDPEPKLEVEREAASEGIVLLKNDGALPVKACNVAMFGAETTKTGGLGSSHVNSNTTVSIPDGMKTVGFKYDFYLDGNVNPDEYDMAMLIVSRKAEEGADMTDEEFHLTNLEMSTLKDVSEAFHNKGKKVIVVINTGNPFEVESWKDMADGIVYVGLAGERVGLAFADILIGSVNPSGKLTETWPKKFEDNPGFASFPGDNFQTDFTEGIYVGYRYYETFNVPVSYEFGYGLSYTEFKYSDFKCEKKDGGVMLSVKVKNVGKAAGKETVQFYMNIPNGENEHPVKELCGFAKTKLLKKGASEVVSVFVDDNVLKTFKNHEWFVEKGTYKFMVGSSVSNIKFEKTIDLERKTVGNTVKIKASKIEVLTNNQ